MTSAIGVDPGKAKVLNGAVSQRDRMRAVPKPAAVSVDGRTLAQMLAFGARYGALVRFYDLSNIDNGDWSAFFIADPAVAAAMLGALDLPDIERSLRLLLAKARAAQKRDERHEHVHHAKRVIVRLLLILDETNPDDGGDPDARLTILATTARQDGIAPPLRDWHRHHRRRPHDDDQEWLYHHLDLLEDLLAAVMAALHEGVAAALASLDAQLSSGGHAPQAALWNAFVMLFDETRQEMNRFPQRLLDFYYGDVLKQNHIDARPDEVFLTFIPTQGVTEAAVPRGARFLAGTDPQGDPIYYAATSSLAVEDVTITALGVHRVTYAPGSGTRQDAPTGVLSGSVALPPPGSAGTMSFPMFGGNRPGPFGTLTMAPASLGFIVESPALLLSGGNRQVSITLAPSRPQPASTSPLHSLALMSTPAAPAPAGTGTGVTLADVMTLAFEMYYSTAGGWIKVDDLAVTATQASGEIPESVVFSFTLPAGAPPLEPASTKPAPDAPAPTLPASAYPTLADQPTVIANLLHESRAASETAGDTPISISTYALLTHMHVTSIAIDVSVDAFIPPVIANPNGRVDPNQTFALFGLSPVHYATVDFAAPEFFVKRLTRLSASIDWAGLPVTTTGFQGYYQGYRLNADGVLSDRPLFDNTTFQVSFSVIAPGLWTLKNSAPLYLFQTPGSSTASSGPAPATTVSGRSQLAAIGLTPQTPPNYYNPALSALRLSLVAPDYAFGNILYASNLLAASSANAAALRAETGRVSSASAHIANAGTTNAKAPAKTYHSDVGQAVGQVLSALNGQVFAALRQALGASAPAQAALQELQAIMGETSASGSLWSRLKARFSSLDDSTVTASLQDWMTAHSGDLAALTGAVWPQAGILLSAAETLASQWNEVAGQAATLARPQLASTLANIQAMVAAPIMQPQGTAFTLSLPNQPWLPMASAFTVSYGAAASVALTQGLPATAPDTAPSRLLHLGPFDAVTTAVAAQPCAGPAVAPHAVGSLMAGAPLLPRIEGRAAFYIDLSAPVAQISLLFILTAGPDGWSSGPSTLTWQKKVGRHWTTIAVVNDTTNGLRNSGVVSLQIATSAHDDHDTAQSLRAILGDGEQNAAYVTSVTANALTAAWVGPGGAARLGHPLPAGAITQSKDDLAGIGAITQPMQSIGGAPPLIGRSFHKWMAEHLRHKGFAISAWDYAQLVLDAIPSLWQLAVVPAIDEASGQAAPGHIWLVAVAGPFMPNISDPTVPATDPSVLTEIGELLAPVASPFARMTVTNPPYLRLAVRATLVFSDADTPGFWIERLQSELTRWLSPWPDAALGPRPADYYTRQALAEFIRQRSYVQSIISLHVIPERDPSQGGWHYFTSALHHDLVAHTPPPGLSR